jgi:hypothetical protein
MAAKLKIEKRGDEILIVHCCFKERTHLLQIKENDDFIPNFKINCR